MQTLPLPPPPPCEDEWDEGCVGGTGQGMSILTPGSKRSVSLGGYIGEAWLMEGGEGGGSGSTGGFVKPSTSPVKWFCLLTGFGGTFLI